MKQHTTRRSPFVVGITPWLVCALALTLVAGCATRSHDRTQIDDAAVTAKIKAKLAADPEVNPFEIDVDTTDGVVRLSGMVEDRGDRDEAVRIARNTDGVIRVVDDLKIGDPTLGEVISDQWIETKVKSKLAADPEVNPFNVDVDVVDGVVTLTGEVEDRKTRDEAVKLARNTKGVRRVESRLRVTGS